MAIILLLAATQTIEWQKTKNDAISDAYISNTNPIISINPDNSLTNDNDKEIQNNPKKNIVKMPPIYIDIKTPSPITNEIVEQIITENANIPIIKNDITHFNHGNTFPPVPSYNEQFLRTDVIPFALYKYNGRKWIEIDKENNLEYLKDNKIIELLISNLERNKYEHQQLTSQENIAIMQYQNTLN